MAGDTSQYVELSFLRPVARTLYRPGRKRKERRNGSSNYPSPRNVSFHGIVPLTYENTLSDSTAAGYTLFATAATDLPGGEIY